MALEKDPSLNGDLDTKKDTTLSNSDLEAESAGRSRHDKSVGGRIAPVLPHLRGYDFGSDDDGADILGKQIELEAGNQLQYRTCSWQKVSYRIMASSLFMGGNFG